MSTEPRAALAALTAAFERHFEAAASRRGEDDPAVAAAYQNLADAFETYEEAIDEAFGELTPLGIYTEDDDEDDEDDDDFDDEDDEDEDEDDDEEDLDDEDDEDGVYVGLDDEEYDEDGEDDDDDSDDAGRRDRPRARR
ncbi:hypothetical protein MM440_16220 [Arsenicicoccus piscis]|uniref:Primosomal protein n=1 Tax=Arsenicicoccus piscis TaxID=673954 RepID=A0ABQ6HMS4_9MICO|nr:hypothetical protein [Arsenicicoccus piscis]MCH8629276.1 hypothetical protein [Arsenicicoccus piscis]GMA19766.1 hypothetical protein GCM10025862_17870 [Arsenicicoccus piscis]